jgi:antitoxin HigA-1
MKQLPPIHPGEILLEDFMKPLGLSPSRVATEIGVSVFRINQIVRSKRAITPEMALRLARYFGTSADIWLRLQVRYDLEVAKAQLTKQINCEVKVLKVQAIAIEGC